MGRFSSKGPIDQALDLFVYLPIGLMFELPRSIPRSIERGRRLLHADDGLQAHAESTLRALGVDRRPSTANAPMAARSATAPARPSTVTSTSTSTAPAPVAPVASSGPVRIEVDIEPRPSVDPAALGIPGYDSLSASQVVPRLAGLATDELELVRAYEQANRGRKTILSKIAQLQVS